MLSEQPPVAEQLAQGVFASGDVRRSLLSQRRREYARRLSADVVLGSESEFRATTDAGSLLGKSNAARGLTTHKRSPIVNDPRVRGSQLGQLLASGSYWFPARQDLDTLLSKIDSRIVQDMIVVKGPYAARYGPAFNYIDIQLLGSPRFACGYENHLSSSLEYTTNGQNWYGRETVWGGNADYGYRVGYGHRTGNDYAAGDGTNFISSYNSRDLDVALGTDLSPDEHLEFSYLRLDQTDVELPGQFLDLRVLFTDAFELTYTAENTAYFDVVTMEGWFNQTRLEGTGQRVGKRRQLPFLDFNNVIVTSDTSNLSTGFRMMGEWSNGCCTQNAVGADLRFLRQEINQIFAQSNFAPFPFNQPLPTAYTANPGLFVETTRTVNERLVLNGGARVDIAEMDASQNPPLWSQTGSPPLETAPNLTFDIEESLGGGSFRQSFFLGSAYATAEYAVDPHWTALLGGAFAMRPPTMTEMYSVGTLVSVFPQNPVTSVVGNPRLNPERRYQIDVGARADYCRMRGQVNLYHAWVEDYTTFDRINPDGVFFAYTQTDLATLAGVDGYAEFEMASWLTAFGTFSFVEGRDHSREGNAIPAAAYRPSGSLRSGVTGDEEPLPVIAPLESTVGLRVTEPTFDPRWGIEFAARMVDGQGRVATSLGELTTPGFTTFDLRGYWAVTPAFTLVSGIENIFDRHYQEHFDARAQNLAQPIPLQIGSGTVPLGTTKPVFRPGVDYYFGGELVF
jgi:outer membrane receptor protein involved in Fe transport